MFDPHPDRFAIRPPPFRGGKLAAPPHAITLPASRGGRRKPALAAAKPKRRFGEAGSGKEEETLPLPRLQHRLDRDVRPGRGALAERHIGRMHLARAFAARGELGEHPPAVLRAAAIRSSGKVRNWTLCVVVSAASASTLSRSISASAKAASTAQACATMALSSASSASQALQRHDAFAGAVRLVEARAVIELRHPVEAERDVGAGADELGGVEHAGLQAGEDFRRRRGLRRGAKPAVDFAAEPERADLEPAQVGKALMSRRNQPPMQTPVLPPMNGLTPNGA